MTYPCMSADELATWIEGAEKYVRFAGQGPMIPCWDCPATFRSAALAAGTCKRVLPRALPPRDGMTSEERAARQRRIKRDWMRASRARAKGYNVPEGSGLESNKVSPDARLSATTREAGVIASIEVVAR